jgi:putative membrane protein
VRGVLYAVLPGTALLAGTGVAFTPVLLHGAWIYAALSTPLALWPAQDAYRNLGHGTHGGFLVTRSGTFSRDTLALQRKAVVAWTFTTSPATRQAGLVTLTAAVAAAAAPGILEEVLEHPAP